MTPSINAQTKNLPLHRCQMIVDGNSHHTTASQALPGSADTLISEALIPQIRMVATLIAGERHDFEADSPAVFTEEADFFAARILVLGVHRFHLDITLLPMLKTANQRAQAFAKCHHLPFTPAQMHMSLHARRPDNLLIVETEHEMENHGSLIANSLAFAAKLPRLPL
ncbi:hypothetical protein [Neisseria sicca]|nr:hypothetical protein [Neisseria sicca]QMT38468.1 hypothetical protein H3L95_02170 [Neisseria sicca]